MGVYHREALGITITEVNNFFNVAVENSFSNIILYLMPDLIPFYASSFSTEYLGILHALCLI